MNSNLLQQLQFCDTLPSLPTIAIKIIELANDPHVDIIKVSHYISLDPALTAKILKLANSPLYKSRRSATNIRQAVCVLGTHAVITIALSFSLTSSLIKQSGNSHHALESINFWRRSIVSALACRALGEKLGLKIPDDLLIIGLLQDIGILAFDAMVPTEYESVFASASNHDALLKAERAAFGIGHDELGYALLKQWHLPDYISLACLASHSQPAPKEIGPAISGCVAVSGYIADYFLDPRETGRIAAATEAAQLWLALDSIALLEVINIMEAELKSVEALFEMTIHHPKHISGILSHAKELLMMQSLAKTRELEDRSQRDGLTGAYNRSYFDSTFEREFILSAQHNLPLTIALIDLDHFKNVNDQYGHLVGDSILIAAVRAIFGQIRQDDILSRFGGEEFALILPGSTLTSAAKLLLRIKNSVAEVRYKLDIHRFVKVTVSMGVAANMDGEMRFERPEDLIKAADLALYAAKHAGRNQIVEWSPSLPIKEIF